ncbi:phosphoenolpyruvate--protein phosphotransferase [Sharpea azabuensis]|jgi:phosphotransferase system enzyme I (PtsI)|uniref:Phosphoenolpyruvate-protein phosphotransferase n=1 Tax=Sharpea azabuensis TaxID=322505 RepID=A0A1H6X2Q8_9FIRM|nr:phosphoenolpyruvate--protein phosphotransferase [Sharpea azabuensis]HAJ15329.1 phosphoenolpyruvate--protein phosphotransferase [Erysipelotrichaceae bacterium]MDD6512107.1 phosphoenolpyruvate--protein phosphotransferase [Sharpea azabuensis]MEE3307880.1 phosphoenolpyruvate--protein phosphotransferase [Sharpea azabuensis]SEJ18875.1 phosphotransferase system, enzyme I, PtsI [Sharpea azabuensis]SFE02419.1 phosphotransferase system, enzyme I, PtsI [Sharpea azabuensis]
MTNIKGIGASSGIAIAKAYKLEMPDLTVSRDTVEDTTAEIKKLYDHKAAVEEEIKTIKEAASKNLSAEEAAVFDAHLMMLNDPEFAGQIESKIKDEKLNAAAALEDVANMMIAMFSSMDDAYFKERAADVKDVSTRWKAHLLGKKLPNPSLISEEVVICANDLTPSDTATLNKNLVKGFVTNIGGRTSHSAILARSMEIPAVVATNTIMDNVNDGDLVVLDGTTGEVFINPDEAVVKEYTEKKEAFEAYKAELKTLVDAESVSTDGHKALLVANIGSPEDLEAVKANGAEGVGLFRTEFLYMESDTLPTEDEQFEVYKKVLEGVNGPVVVRTLDIGGDKKLKSFETPDEMNPFLGVRAIRLCFQHEDIFRTQLRALLRASVYGDLHIMFPMIATLGEFRKAKGILMEEKAKLEAEGVKVSDNFEVGIMIEIPAAAVLADQFAKEVDFFSIGTNDLIQYTFAADRMSSTINYLYQPFNPSILRLVKNTIDAAHANGKWTGMCGEMAGEALAAPLLLGLGLDEFSMSATSILAQRKRIRSLSYEESKKLAEDCLNNAMTMEEVVAKVTEETGITE